MLCVHVCVGGGNTGGRQGRGIGGQIGPQKMVASRSKLEGPHWQTVPRTVPICVPFDFFLCVCCCLYHSVYLFDCLCCLFVLLSLLRRWHNHLNPDIVKEAWTPEEDAQILLLHSQMGNKWAELAKLMKGRYGFFLLLLFFSFRSFLRCSTHLFLVFADCFPFGACLF